MGILVFALILSGVSMIITWVAGTVAGDYSAAEVRGEAVAVGICAFFGGLVLMGVIKCGQKAAYPELPPPPPAPVIEQASVPEPEVAPTVIVPQAPPTADLYEFGVGDFAGNKNFGGEK